MRAHGLEPESLAVTETITVGGESLSPYRNLIINGDMLIWQRGELFNPLNTSPQYVAVDRWSVERGGSGDSTISDSGSSLTEFRKSVQLASGDSNSKNLYAWQRIEGDNFLSLIGETVYVGAWVYVSVNENASIYIYSNDSGTRDAWASAENFGNTLIKQVDNDITSGVWTYISTTFTVTSECANGVALGIRFGEIDNSVGCYITGVRMHRGSVEIPWSVLSRTPEEEMALCQRYFEKSYSHTVAVGATVVHGMHYSKTSGTSLIKPIPFRVEKRIPPTVISYSPDSGSAGYSYDYNGAADFAVSSNTTGTTGFYSISASAVDQRQYGMHWTADAEL